MRLRTAHLRGHEGHVQEVDVVLVLVIIEDLLAVVQELRLGPLLGGA